MTTAREIAEKLLEDLQAHDMRSDWAVDSIEQALISYAKSEVEAAVRRCAYIASVQWIEICECNQHLNDPCSHARAALNIHKEILKTIEPEGEKK